MSGCVVGQKSATQSLGLPGPFASVTEIVPPAATVVAPSVAVGPETVNVTALEVPPPGAGVNTVIALVPALTRSAAVRAAVSEVDDTNVVVRGEPSTRIADAAVKFVPVAVIENAGPPDPTLAGEMLLSVGAAGFATVIVGLVARFIPPLNSLTLHVVPAVDGAVKVTVALVNPVEGAVCELFRYFQAEYVESLDEAGQ